MKGRRSKQTGNSRGQASFQNHAPVHPCFKDFLEVPQMTWVAHRLVAVAMIDGLSGYEVLAHRVSPRSVVVNVAASLNTTRDQPMAIQ
ncbi:hypothetical protein [Thioalkalivibrio sp.]|uniref:hypothetical protein n=1 Tax=Thioalkalivibrio sp. TaxID=2093813 RepID=UPI0025FDD3D0|nr:hypothetical protein [Thioalkalivibrio sp.]